MGKDRKKKKKKPHDADGHDSVGPDAASDRGSDIARQVSGELQPATSSGTDNSAREGHADMHAKTGSSQVNTPADGPKPVLGLLRQQSPG